MRLKVTVEISLSNTAMRTRLVIKKSWDTAQRCGVCLAGIESFADKVGQLLPQIDGAGNLWLS